MSVSIVTLRVGDSVSYDVWDVDGDCTTVKNCPVSIVDGHLIFQRAGDVVAVWAAGEWTCFRPAAERKPDAS